MRKPQSYGASEPDWTDIDSAKKWLEQRFVGSIEAGSPIYQYFVDLKAKGIGTDWREEHLSGYELDRWLRANEITSGIHYPCEYDRIVYYPEYQYPGYPVDKQPKLFPDVDVKRAKSSDGASVLKERSYGRKTSKRVAAKQQSQDRPKGKSKRKAVNTSKSTRKTDPARVEERIRTLRPRDVGRQRRETGKTQCIFYLDEA